MHIKGKFLYVVDNPDSCEIIGNVFDSADVVCASTGQEALQLITADPSFSLYLFDHVLPDTTGLELCREVRRIDSRTPILFISSMQTLSIAEVREAGAQGLIRKATPYFIEQLKQTVFDLLTQPSGRDCRLIFCRIIG